MFVFEKCNTKIPLYRLMGSRPPLFFGICVLIIYLKRDDKISSLFICSASGTMFGKRILRRRKKK